MSAKRAVNKTKFTPEQRAEHRRIRELFADWHPSPEELIVSGEGSHFSRFGEYPYLRPFLAQLKQAREYDRLLVAEGSACGVQVRMTDAAEWLGEDRRTNRCT
jgi:hypothetical protein